MTDTLGEPVWEWSELYGVNANLSWLSQLFVNSFQLTVNTSREEEAPKVLVMTHRALTPITVTKEIRQKLYRTENINTNCCIVLLSLTVNTI